MGNRFLEILGFDDVCVNLVSGIWRVEIPAHLLNSEESEMLEQKWDMPQGNNGFHLREMVAHQTEITKSSKR